MANSWPVLPNAPEVAPLAMTVEAWLALAEDEPGEVVAGYLVEEEVPDATHELVVAWLLWTLKSWLKPQGGLVLGSELKVRVGERTGRKPDVVVYLPGSKLPQRRGAVTAAPDIVIEVVSPSPRDERRDRIEKMAEYANFGVRFYWLVDPALGSLEIFEWVADLSRGGGRYAKAVGVTAGSVQSVPGCVGLVLDVDDLWRELERLPPE